MRRFVPDIKAIIFGGNRERSCLDTIQVDNIELAFAKIKDCLLPVIGDKQVVLLDLCKPHGDLSSAGGFPASGGGIASVVAWMARTYVPDVKANAFRLIPLS